MVAMLWRLLAFAPTELVRIPVCASAILLLPSPHSCNALESSLSQRSTVSPDSEADPIRRLALQAAAVAYRLPDLESLKSARQLEEDYQQLEAATPAGYFIMFVETDVESGLKLVMFAPRLENPTGPFILAVAGTHSFLDWLANINLGAAQLRNIERLSAQVLRWFSAETGRPIELIVTGHSLGGGLAQAIAFDLDGRLKAENRPGTIYLITWNAFGGKELIQRVNPRFDEQTSRVRMAWNYYVRDDPVSKIGMHVGIVYELVPKAPAPAFKGLRYLKKIHSLETVAEVAGPDGSGLRGLSAQRPPQAETLKKILGHTALFDWLPRLAFDIRYKKITDILAEKLDQLRARSVLEGSDLRFARYVESLSEQVIESMRSNPHAKLSIEVLERKRARLRKRTRGSGFSSPPPDLKRRSLTPPSPVTPAGARNATLRAKGDVLGVRSVSPKVGRSIPCSSPRLSGTCAAAGSC